MIVLARFRKHSNLSDSFKVGDLSSVQLTVGVQMHCMHYQSECGGELINSCNRNEWNPIRSVIIQVITKSDVREA